MPKKISKQQLQKTVNDSKPHQVIVAQLTPLQEDTEKQSQLKQFIAFVQALVRNKTTTILIAIEEK